MKMRPLRVKVRKPAVVEDMEEMPDAMDETFGLKNPESNSDLVLEPTPAVPGRPVSLDMYVRDNMNYVNSLGCK